jgi:hypothetical protein
MPALAAGRPARRAWLVFAAALLAAAVPGEGAAQALEIIELRHRPAEQLIPLLAPLTAGGSVTGTGFTLIVRAGAAQIAQIRQVVASLDRAPRQLLISVRQDLGGSMRAGGAGAQVILAPGGSRAQGSLYERTGTAQDDIAQQVRTLEGNPAFVQTGTSSLVPQRTVTRTPGGTIVQESVVQRDLNTGVWVMPRVSGETVILEIATQRDALAGGPGGGSAPGGVIVQGGGVGGGGIGPGAGGVTGAGAASTNRLVTTVSGRLGEWLDLGGVSTAQSVESRGILARSSEAALGERRVWVRVEEVR